MRPNDDTNPQPTRLHKHLLIVGSYQLVRAIRQIVETGEEFNSFGERPSGYLMYNANGTMLAATVYDVPRTPDTVYMTDQEKVVLFNSLLFYGGTYTFDGETVTHQIDMSYNELLTGQTRSRRVRFVGDCLELTTPPERFSADGRLSVSKVTWKKL